MKVLGRHALICTKLGASNCDMLPLDRERFN